MIAQNTESKQLTEMEEAFCQIKARCITTDSQAYRNAGYKNSKYTAQNAHKLAIKPYIKTRIEDIKALRTRKVEVTPRLVAIEAEDQRQIALGQGDLKAANQALVIKAKAYGCQTDKVLNDQTDEAKARQVLTAEQQASFDRWIAHELEQSIRQDKPDLVVR